MTAAVHAFASGREATNPVRGFRSVLVPVELAARPGRVLERASHLPFAEHAVVTLVHVVSPAARARAVSEAKQALSVTASRLARWLPAGTRISRVVAVGSAPAQIARVAASSSAELIVMGRGDDSAVRDAFVGSTAERVVRGARRPVLVARAAHGDPYRRPLLAVDPSHPAPGILALASRVLPHPAPPFSVVHAYRIPAAGPAHRGPPAEPSLRRRADQRQKALRRVERSLSGELAAPGAPALERLHWRTHVRHGDPRTIVPALVSRTRADLLVVGTRARTGLPRAVSGTVAGELLRRVSCDVLLVPSR